MARFIDISVAMSPEMVRWPSDPPFEISPFKTIAEGGSSNVSVVTMGTHSGTHVDSPRHFIEEGTSVDRLPLDLLVGECVVVEDARAPVINKSVLSRLLQPLDRTPERLLFKTRASGMIGQDRFFEDYVWLDESAALELVFRRIMLVGIDYLSVAPPKGGAEVHRILLEAGVVVIEGLDLSEAAPGVYELLCLPLRISEGDGSPARVVLRTKD
ncbi:MAG: cyclase family protein [Actinobacteria bacterium]|nr:MAG: cyclase family protein [Actinomycetota bacterium]